MSRSRLRHTGWLLRYWVLDKHRDRLRPAAMWLAMGVAFIAGLDAAGVWTSARAQGQQEAWVQVVWQIAIMVVSALISYSMRPKIEKPKPLDANVPVVEDGKAIITVFGTVWVDDSVILAWKNLGTEEIKSKTGKKWSPGLLPGTTNPIESWLDNKWNVSGLANVTDPLGGGTSGGDDDEDDEGGVGEL
ncbi:hypothetical protein [Stenotrophomonas sp. PS02298]|uniref:hypothetical protein n=1 Tax=Stenotrophomonas sp. PS02298 TaxID=2991424 RepID=UPI00249C6101|nr:hypothetical protein [Stenotrophomonas sp. PS02298]